MSSIARTGVDRTAAPADRPTEVLEVAALGPPEPLRRTLETLEAAADETVLVQVNDREPQFLYPKLEDRGYEYETFEADAGTITTIWRPE